MNRTIDYSKHIYIISEAIINRFKTRLYENPSYE